jgi:predicted negative regulator of RcsB-dependent stress response
MPGESQPFNPHCRWWKFTIHYLIFSAVLFSMFIASWQRFELPSKRYILNGPSNFSTQEMYN